MFEMVKEPSGMQEGKGNYSRWLRHGFKVTSCLGSEIKICDCFSRHRESN